MEIEKSHWDFIQENKEVLKVNSFKKDCTLDLCGQKHCHESVCLSNLYFEVYFDRVF